MSVIAVWSADVEIGPRRPPGFPAGLLDSCPENDRVIQGEILAPDELGIFEIEVIKRFLRTDFLLRELRGVAPTGVVEVPGKPVARNLGADDPWVGRVAVQWTSEKGLRLPTRTRNSSVSEPENEAAVTDARPVFAPRLGVGVVHRQYRNRHWVFGEDVQCDHVVGQEVDGVHRDLLTVDVEDKPVVGVNARFDRIAEIGLDYTWPSPALRQDNDCQTGNSQ